MERQTHWQKVYGGKRWNEVSWYADHLERSLALIKAVADRGAAVIDVGGGASTLVDDLLAEGYTDLTVLDLSATALQAAKERLGPRAKAVTWLIADIASASLPQRRYDVWHDRAVFHFLTAREDRLAYAERARVSLKPGGHIVMSTFAPEGPSRCSGLDVNRYDGPAITRELRGFELIQESRLSHTTPSGAEQAFACFLLRK
jgi:SAM-dependent methyltransferase